MQKKLFIFDLDGTLLNTIDDLHSSVNATLARFGYPARTKEEVLSFVGNGYVPLLTLALPKAVCEEHFDEVVAYFKKYYAEHSREKTCPFQGIENVLDQITAKGGMLAVLSNKGDAQVKELVQYYFGNRFQVVLGERAGIRKKPYPDSVEETLKTLGVHKSDAVYIGDSEVDVQTAKNADTDCVCVDWGFRSRDCLEKAGASVIVSSMDELLQVLST